MFSSTEDQMMQKGTSRWRLALLKGAFYVGARLSAGKIRQPRFVIRAKRWLKSRLIGILGSGQPLLVTVRGRQMYLRPDLLREYVADEYEPFTVEIFERSIRPGATVLDIGAGVGYFTLIAGERVGKTGKVYAFEPVPETFELLAQNVQVNRLETVTPVRKAVGESDGQTALFVAELPEQSGLYQVPSDRLNRVTVADCVSIDDFLSAENVDVVKIDTEGFEPQVLRGMTRTLLNSPGSPVLFVELNPVGLRRGGLEPQDLLEQLRAMGFSTSIIDEQSRSCIAVDPKSIGNWTWQRHVNLYCTRTAVQRASGT
jgi:FkbM family methyltransferase